MGFHPEDCMVRVDRFKERGKWYDTFAIDMSRHYDHPDLHDAIEFCIRAAGYTLQDWVFVCLEPYHKNAHPVMLKGRG